MAYKIEKSRKEIFSGELITYGDIKHRPKLKWPTLENKFYTLYMTGNKKALRYRAIMIFARLNLVIF